MGHGGQRDLPLGEQPHLARLLWSAVVLPGLFSDALRPFSPYLHRTAGVGQLTRSYYRGAAGALLVYDVTYRRSFEHVGQWLDDLRKFADEGVSIILVGNRTDLTSDEDAQESMQEQAKQRSTNPQPGEEGTASTAALPHDVAAAANSPISEPSLAQTTAEDHPGREDVAAASSKLDSPSSSTVGRRKKRQVPKKEAAAWAEENGLLFVETSAKTGSKVEEAFASAARDIHTQFLARATCAPATPTATIRPNLETTVPRPSGAQTGCC